LDENKPQQAKMNLEKDALKLFRVCLSALKKRIMGLPQAKCEEYPHNYSSTHQLSTEVSMVLYYLNVFQVQIRAPKWPFGVELLQARCLIWTNFDISKKPPRKLHTRAR
jgi:hypothetical protein